MSSSSSAALDLPVEWRQQMGPRAEEEEGAILLQKERATASVRPEAMATFFYGGRTALAKRLQMQAFIEQDPVFSNADRIYLDQPAKYLRSSEKAVHLIKKCQALGLPYEAIASYFSFALDEISPVDVHMKMVVPALTHQTTTEQRAKWLPLAQNFQILCAYAQTELGHGSNVQGLETTAKYDPATQTFTIHSPNLRAAKFWPGGLGKTATHALIMARLLLGGRDLGIHSFIVQIRSLIDHSPLPGVTMGDIGPKIGFNSVDNGYLLFNNVVIPRDGMLMGLMEVTPDGQYRKKTDSRGEKVLYGSMLDVRAHLVEKAPLTLARAVTIAVRYSCVRKQGFEPSAAAAAGKPKGGAAGKVKPPRRELQVLDYPTQQHALMPLLAWAYALQATGQHMRRLYHDYMRSLDLSLLPEVHSLSSGLKALTAEVVAEGVNRCRLLCGGHGYLQSSGFPELFTNYTAVQTFEGTEQILQPQLARFILRIAAHGHGQGPEQGKGDLGFKLSSDFDYVKDAPAKLGLRCGAAEARDLLSPALQVEAFECRASAALLQASQAVQEELAQGASLQQALSRHGVLLGKLARAHCELVILTRFHESVAAQERRQQQQQQQRSSAGRDGDDRDSEVAVGQAEARVLRDLCSLFALSVMEREAGDFRAQDYLSAEQAAMCGQEVLRLCRGLRAEAVCLVDAFQLSDKLLCSTLGLYDGRVYEAIFEEVLKSQLNDAEVTPAYHMYWRQLVTAQGGAAGGGARL